jgi:hypothetical protein
MTTIVLIHGGKSTVPKLEDALPGAKVAVVYREGLSGAYNEVTGIAHDYPTLGELMAEYAPWWSPGEPLVVLGFSAGGWALRYYLRDPEARDQINAAIFLDATYGTADGKCTLGVYDGVIAYGEEANARPAEKRLIMTYSQATPGPGICANAIQAAVGEGPGVFVTGYSNGDHSAQQGVVGPEQVRELVAPWIHKKARSAWAWGFGVLALLAGAVFYWRRRR